MGSRSRREGANQTQIVIDDLPPIGDREAIRVFAASFDGYQHFGSFEACASAVKAKRRESLLDLRNELFFSFRSSHHRGTDDFVETYSTLLPHFRKFL